MRVRRLVEIARLSLVASGCLCAPGQTTQEATAEGMKKADAAFSEGYAARLNGNLALAQAKFAEVVKLERGIAEAHEALGAVLVEMGKPADAITELEAAAKLKPRDAGNQANLGIAYVQAGKTAEAIPHLEAAKSAAQA